MEALDFWRLCDDLTISQAAHLLVGIVPGEIEAMSISGNMLTPDSNRRFQTSFQAAQTAITNALKAEKIKGVIQPFDDYDSNGNAFGYVRDSVNPDTSSIEVDSLRRWLKHRGFTTGFFFPDAPDVPDYLDSLHPRYSPKLAASVNAWLNVTAPGKGSVKQALDKWLRENAAQYRLVDDEGKHINQAIEDCSKVANWNFQGGAPKTPS